MPKGLRPRRTWQAGALHNEAMLTADTSSTSSTSRTNQHPAGPAARQPARSALQPFGLAIDGFDVRQATPREINGLKQALAEHGVVVLRGQHLDDRQFARFLGRLGTPTFTVGETPVPDEPLLNIVSNVGRSKPPRSVFHTDTSYVARPPAYTALRAVRLPQSGGETVFSNQYRAYDSLAPRVRDALRDAAVLHVVSGLPPGAVQETESWHPLFLRHPISGRVALFLSTPERCQAITGMAADTARRVIALLYRHSIRPQHLYRHRWRPDDILLWDNRCTLHRGDHAEVVGDRVFHRGLVLP